MARTLSGRLNFKLPSSLLDPGWDEWTPRWNVNRGYVQMADAVADHSGDSYRSFVRQYDMARRVTADERINNNLRVQQRKNQKKRYRKRKGITHHD